MPLKKLTDAQQKFFDRTKPGDVLAGKVKRITHYGAFVRLGLMDGLMGLKEISWGRIKDASDHLKIHQKVEVVVLQKNEQEKTLFVGMKQLIPHPWTVAASKFKTGDTVVGNIVDVQRYGAFLEIFPGFEGLIHVSDAEIEGRITDANEIFKPGQTYEATIKSIDFEKRKLALTLK